MRMVVLLLIGLVCLEGTAHAQTATYYGHELAGRRTASGETFNPNALTAAHRTKRKLDNRLYKVEADLEDPHLLFG